MEKRRKDARIFNCYLETQIYEQLYKYCSENGYTMTRITEKALEAYLKDKNEIEEK